jgi:hypothetical protein
MNIKKRKIIWESLVVDINKKRIFYKTEDHYHHFLNVPFKDLLILEKDAPEHYKIFQEILYRNYGEWII